MQVQTHVEGTTATLELEGKLTVQTVQDLREAVDELSDGVRDFDIDLAGVSYIASAGLRILVGIGKLAIARGGKMRLLHPCDYVMEVLEMTGLSGVYAIEK